MGQPSEEGSKAAALSKRVTRLLETKLDNDKETLLALKEISLFFPENTQQSRRNLRTKIEKRSLEINEDFLSSFRKVKENLDSIYIDVTEMNLSIQNIADRLNSSMTQTHALIEQTSKLQQERRKLSMEEGTIGAFVSKLQLSPAELTALRECAVAEDFFSALERVRSITEDCQTLLATGPCPAASDIAHQMNVYEETGMERLYRWTQVNCRNVESSATGKLLARAMAKLQVRDQLFKGVMVEYCEQRRGEVVRRFMEVVMRGGPGGDPPPLEATASTDPRRYVSDLLSYVQSCLPGERALLQALLIQVDQSQVGDLIEDSLSEILGGVCTPLRVRIEHVIASNIPPKTLYSINSTLMAFHRAFSMEAGEESTVVACLNLLIEAANENLLAALGSTTRRLLTERAVAQPAAHLAPSLEAIVALLQDILSSPADPAAHHQLDKIVGAIVDPVLQAINVSASRLSTVDMAVYLLNCLHQLQTVLSLYQFLDTRLERLQAQAEAQLDTLTSEQAGTLVAHLGLGPVYTILQDKSRGPLANVPGLGPTDVAAVAAKLESHAALAEAATLGQVNCLVSSAHRETVLKRSTEYVMAVYRELYKAVHDKSNLYEAPDNLLSRTPEQLATLLHHNATNTAPLFPS